MILCELAAERLVLAADLSSSYLAARVVAHKDFPLRIVYICRLHGNILVFAARELVRLCNLVTLLFRESKNTRAS